MARDFDPYDVLDVPSDATLEHIRVKHLRLLKRLHPDIAAPEQDHELKAYFNKRASELNQAWDILRDPEKRALYDASHSEPRLIVTNVEADVEVEPGQDALVRFKVDNAGGPVPPGKRLTFSSSDKRLDFDLLRCESVNAEATFPLEVELLFRASGLPPGTCRETLVDVLLEDV